MSSGQSEQSNSIGGVPASPATQDRGVFSVQRTDTPDQFDSEDDKKAGGTVARSPQKGKSTRFSGSQGDSILPTDPVSESSSKQRTNTTISSKSAGSSVIEPPWDKQYVISFDGGGIRGYSSLLIVRRLMTEIMRIEMEHEESAETSYYPLDYVPSRNNSVSGEKKSNQSGNGKQSVSLEETEREQRSRYLPCHYFDYIGGTSTGGLISIMLSRLRMNIDDCITEYETLGGEIFGHPRIASIRGPIPAFRDKYDGSQLKRVVEGVISRRLDITPGEVAYFSSHQSICKTIVVANKQKTVEDGDLILEPPYLFRSYDHYPAVSKNPSERNPGRAHHGEIWQVARATSAAPTYFAPITINNRKFGDGGFGTNNPAWEVIWEVTQMTGKASELGNIALIVSIGTGRSPLSKFGQGLLGKYYAYFKAAKKLAVDSEDVHDRMMTITRGKVPYYRFNVKDGLGEMKLDEWKAPKNWRRRKENLTLKRIQEKTDDYLQLQEVRVELRKLAEVLVENRRKRCKTAIWDTVCLGMQYRCCFEGCPKAHKMRRSARDLRTHLRISHRLDEEKAEDKKKIEMLIDTGRCPC